MRVPTDTPPGDNAPHAKATAVLLEGFGFAVERHPVPDEIVRQQGMASLTNLVVRRRYGDGPTIALNAHGDVVPPGEGWHHDPYGGEVGRPRGRLPLRPRIGGEQERLRDLRVRRARARIARRAARRQRRASLHLRRGIRRRARPGPPAEQGIVKPDLLIAAGFSHQVVTAHNGCLQLEVTVHGKMAHAAIPATGVDALQGAVGDPRRALCRERSLSRDHVERRGHHPSVPQRRPHRRRHQHQRRAGQGRAAPRPPHDPRGRSGRRRSRIAPADRRCGRAPARHRDRHPPPPARPRAQAAAGQCCAGRRAAEARRGGVRRADRRIGHAALHRRAPLRRSRHPGGDLRRRAAHRARIERQARRRAPRARRPARRDQGRRADAARAARSAPAESAAAQATADVGRNAPTTRTEFASSAVSPMRPVDALALSLPAHQEPS